MLDHRAGQYKAELFEEILGFLLRAKFRGAQIIRHFVVPKSSRQDLGAFVADYVVMVPNGETVLVEAKAPYSENARFGVERRVRALKQVMSALVRTRFLLKINRIVLAVAAELPLALRSEIQADHAQFFQSLGAAFEIWDATDIGRDLLEYFHQRPATMSVDALAGILTALREGWPELARFSSGESAWVITAPVPPPQIVEGERQNVVVLCCDFCSYSKFVHASGTDRDLVVSIMGRFYRETRAIIDAAGGILDKYMGDGILSFWPTDASSMQDVGVRVDRCVYDLTGAALAIGEAWQDEIDLAVDPTGMTFGAAIGTVLFISESHDSKPPIHAIGECINLAARLQGLASPNSLLITNKLKKACFPNDPAFEESTPVEAKNIGKVMAWKKEYELEDTSAAGAGVSP